MVKRYWKRAVMLLVTGISLYLLLPSLVSTFSSWRSLAHLDWYWAGLAVLTETASFGCIWWLQRVSLRRRGWFVVPVSQLAGNAVGRIVPGGGAAATATQIRMLQQTGTPAGQAATALGAASALELAAVLALPVLALPPILGGAPVARGLAIAAVLGAVLLLLMLTAGGVAFTTDRPLLAVGRAAGWLVNRTIRRRRPVVGLGEKLLAQRATIRQSIEQHWVAALVAAIGVPVFDFGALLCSLRAVGSHPRPSLVLLAYASASLLSLIPVTPGGLGFVEAGLTGTLTLAGVSPGAAVTTTLLYRLVSFWLPIPAGGIAYALFRNRYGSTSVTVDPSHSTTPT